MSKTIHAPLTLTPAADTTGHLAEVQRQEALLKTGALQSAIFNSANFSSIATDAHGVIQIFNVGAERMLGYTAADVVNKITPADISDPQEVIARAKALSVELDSSITPGFEALVFKASRGIEDIYELTYIRKDGSRFPAVVSVTALRDDQEAIIGYLLIGTDNTARKEAEEALSRAGALQTAIFNSANFSSIATDAQGVIQIFNVGAARMLGYTAADVVNKITPADISDPQEVIARAKALSIELDSSITPGFEALVFKASRGIEDIYELTYIRKDGSRFPAVVSVTALRDDQEAIIGYLLIGTDNTARKQADDKLRAAGQYARSLIEASLDPLVTISPDGKITDVNEGSVMVTGVSREKLIGTDFSDYFTEPETAREGYREAFSKGSVTDYPLTIRHQDGRLTDVLYNASVYKDAAGKVLGVFAAARDITARKQVEEEQKKLGQRLRDHQFYTRSLFESNIDALMTTDPEGIITDVNKQMEALSGCTRDELIGAPFKNNFTDPERAEAGIKLVLLKKKVTNYELTVSARDGNETVVSYNATTLYDRNRKLQGVFAAARDITEHKLAQAQILNLALHDPLTQLPNRRLLNELLGRTLAASQRNGRYAALMFLDLDNFKSLNDTQGHHIGDLLLVEVSRRIIHCVRGIDVVARLGGDEFVVILKELDTDLNKSIEEANIVAEKIRAALEEPYLLTFAEAGKVEATVEHRCTSSIGVVVFINHDQGQDGILKWADTAMYEAKKAGRNMIMFYDPAWK